MARIHRFSDEGWAEGAAEEVAERLRAALADGPRATLLLAGGGTPEPLYRALARASGIDWSRVHFFWGDERHVPPDHPDSNFRMARESLLAPLGIMPDDPRVHRMPTESGTPAADASLYEQNLRAFFDLAPRERPRFDVVLLGVGEDGHTASLFPQSEALDEDVHLVVANPLPDKESIRLTVTFPVLNAARTIFFLVRGSSKAAILAAILDGAAARFPAQQVRPHDGELIWLVDDSAASALPAGADGA